MYCNSQFFPYKFQSYPSPQPKLNTAWLTKLPIATSLNTTYIEDDPNIACLTMPRKLRLNCAEERLSELHAFHPSY